MEDILKDVLQSLYEKTSSFLLTAYAPVDSKIENMKAKRNRLIEDAERRNKAILEAEQDSDTENARDIVLDIGDIVDDFIYHQNEQRNWTIFDKIIHFPNTLYRQYRISSELDNINTRIDEWRSLVYSDFKGSTRGSTSSSSSSHNYNVERVKIHGESNLFLEADDLVGIEGPKQELMDLLMKKDRNRIVISVLGMGGSGKTTLVANIFNNAAVKQHFRCCCVWITVSQTTRTVQDLLKYILKDLYQAVMTRPYPINFGDMSYKEMVETIQKLLTGKRYLVVLDDVWNVDTMGIVNLEKAFPGDKPGSRIILTTREMNHAYSLFEVQSLHFHNIEPLGGEKAWQLFCRKAFPLLGGYSCPAEIEPIARDLAKKCGGLPLGLVALGGLMSTKRELDDWFRVLKNLNWELSSNRKVEVINKILLLSYHDLPHHLKQCFLYCCIFPEDFLIQRGRLIRLWIAEGFVELQNSGTTLEETAAGYIDDLVCRSMLQVWNTIHMRVKTLL